VIQRRNPTPEILEHARLVPGGSRHDPPDHFPDLGFRGGDALGPGDRNRLPHQHPDQEFRAGIPEQRSGPDAEQRGDRIDGDVQDGLVPQRLPDVRNALHRETGIGQAPGQVLHLVAGRGLEPAQNDLAEPGVEHASGIEQRRPVVGHGADYRKAPCRERLLVPETVLQRDAHRPAAERFEQGRRGSGRMRLDGDEQVVGPKVGELPGGGCGEGTDRRVGRSLHADAVAHDLAEPLAAGHDRHRVARGKTGGEDAAGCPGAEDQETERISGRHQRGFMTE